jgi:hypothetical protein
LPLIDTVQFEVYELLRERWIAEQGCPRMGETLIPGVRFKDFAEVPVDSLVVVYHQDSMILIICVPDHVFLSVRADRVVIIIDYLPSEYLFFG